MKRLLTEKPLNWCKSIFRDENDRTNRAKWINMRDICTAENADKNYTCIEEKELHRKIISFSVQIIKTKGINIVPHTICENECWTKSYCEIYVR